MKIVLLRRTSEVEPAKWEGETVHGGPVFVRFWKGRLTVHVGNQGVGIEGAIDAGIVYYDGRHGDGNQGAITWPEVEAITGLEAV